METTIRLNVETKNELDKLRQYKSESYDELIRKIIYVVKTCEKEPELSQKTIKEIKEARERIKKGNIYTEEEAKKILGLWVYLYGLNFDKKAIEYLSKLDNTIKKRIWDK